MSEKRCTAAHSCIVYLLIFLKGVSNRLYVFGGFFGRRSPDVQAKEQLWKHIQ